ncbi:hypothetical protein FSP39_011706 [Pinctada imbricata]|uniref:Arrestin C-terminal-like domain-containing protein n=1 Tax=Pinctada imbricata TaxID=66713 RepID=A0AA89C0J5_PINIB|nr:hypothetical protein FSP39_011706 [Pinctada imbricata]
MECCRHGQLQCNAFSNFLQKPSENEGHKTICCLCCASGPITGHIKVERMGYVPGQVIPVDGDVMNNANKTMKEVKVHLIQEVRYITQSKTKVCHVRAAENMLGQLGGNKPMLLHGTRILVPPLPPSGLLGCNIIDINYYAEVS